MAIAKKFGNERVRILSATATPAEQENGVLLMPPIDLGRAFSSYVDARDVDDKFVLHLRSIVEPLGCTHVLLYVDYHLWPFIQSALEPLKVEFWYYSRCLLRPIQKILAAESLGFKEYHRRLDIRVAIEQRAIDASSKVFVNAENQKKILSELYGRVAAGVITPGVNLDFWWNDGPDLFDKRALVVGRLDIEKGIHRVVKGVPDIEVSIVGEPIFSKSTDYPSSMALGAPSNTRFLGSMNQAQLKERMKLSTFSLVPSIYEPWGNVITESMAVGRVCIAQFDCGGAAEHIDHEVDGFLVDFSTNDWVQLIRDLALAPEKVKSVAARAKQNASRHSYGHFIDSWEKKIQENLYLRGV